MFAVNYTISILAIWFLFAAVLLIVSLLRARPADDWLERRIFVRDLERRFGKAHVEHHRTDKPMIEQRGKWGKSNLFRRDDSGKIALPAQCCVCWRVRDFDGNWIPMHGKLDHASHGFCNEDFKRLYPDIYSKREAMCN
jgi:hypothetical protein